MEGVIYCYHCISTGKKYIGQTSNMERRVREHFSYSTKSYRDNKFYRAVKKYGWYNFIYGIIETVSIEEMDSREIYFIEFYKTYKKGYNSTTGGSNTRGYRHKEETKQLLREMRIGQKHSKETKLKMSKDRKGIPKHSLRGRNLTEEHKKKLSEKLSGETHPMYGKKHSDESKLKMKLSFTEERKNKIKQSNKNRENKYFTFKITFDTGIEVFVSDGIEKWCKKNGYNLSEIYKLKRGEKKNNKYKDIIKIEVI